MSIKKVTQHPSQNEALIFERSQTGRIGYRLPKLDVEEASIDSIIPAALRRDDDLDGVPEVSEVDVVRHFTRISTWNYSIDMGMYPLGSCTMKYNSRLNEKVARIGGFTNLHPLAPEEESQGALELIWELQNDLCEITGLAGISLQPAAGAQGEMTGRDADPCVSRQARWRSFERSTRDVDPRFRTRNESRVGRTRRLHG
jgi:glycine dehydrogenase subunit 2